MSLTCPVDLDVARLRAEIQAMYARVAAAPDGEFHFHRGPEYAARVLGYDEDELARLPRTVTECFAGVGNPHLAGPLAPGSTVVDIGCGAGTDLLLAAMHVGRDGLAIGVDMTADMRERARRGAEQCGFTHVVVRAGDATSLPVESGSIDTVISNGVLNLVTDKPRAIAEIARVLKPGGRLHLADVAIGMQLPESAKRDVDLWSG